MQPWTRALLICCGWLIGWPASISAQEPGPLRKFTQAHTRVVWVQDQSASNNDILAVGQKLQLMGLDSDDGQGERVILGDLRNYAKPLLTPDGSRVVYSDQQTQKFYVVNWDGTGKKLLGDGLAVDVWRDPRGVVDLVYVAKRVGKPENVMYRNLRRVQLDNPKISQKVWDQTEIGCDNFQLSADGTRAGGEFPWPNGGVADLQKRTWRKLETGCWSSIAPDNSGISWVFDGPHRHLQFHRPDAAAGWKVAINTAPGINNAEVFHPRWSNHVQFFGMTGPYTVPGKVNVISGGGPQVEVYLGRFSPDFKSVEAWHAVTHNNRGDFYPDVWIAGGQVSVVELPGLNAQPPVAAIAPPWPATQDGLLFAWNNSSQTNQLPDRPGHPGRVCQLKLQGRVVPGEFHDLRFQGGTAIPEDLAQASLTAIKASRQFTIEMLVTPESATSPQATFCEMGPTAQPYLRLLQKGPQLSVHPIKSGVGAAIDEWNAPSPVLVSLKVTPEITAMYVNGRYRGGIKGSQDVQNWTSADLRFGSASWKGRLEALTVYSRGLTDQELQLQAAAVGHRLKTRTPVAATRVQAKCIERTTIPAPAQILPYRRALAVHEFEIQEILAKHHSLSAPKTTPPLEPGARILVAQWVILDGQVLPEASQPAVGAAAELTLELVEQHPELKSERQILETTELDLPLYYSVDFAAQTSPAS